MRRIINFCLTMFVLWAAGHWYPENVYIDNTKTLILITVIMFALNLAYSYFMLASFLTIPIGIGCVTFVMGIIIAFIFNPLRLYIADVLVPDFHIIGFWTYILISVVLSVSSISIEKTKKDKVKEDE